MRPAGPEGVLVLSGMLMALAMTALLEPLVIALLRRRQVLDRPNQRSSHHHPTPRGGGLAIAFAMVSAAAVSGVVRSEQGAALVVAPIALAAIGFLDDVRGIPALTRLSLQVIVALLVTPLVLMDLPGPWPAVIAAAGVVWIVAYVNAFNFMDGINGISAAQVLVAGVAWWMLGEAKDVPELRAGAAIAVGGALGFAPFNFPSARVFLGDIGSYFLGAWLAVLTLVGLQARLTPEAILAPLVLYLADTGTTILRRLGRGERLHEPHRDHAYQRLTQRGWSHGRTTGAVAAAMIACSLLGAATVDEGVVGRVVLDAAMAAVVAGYLLAPRFAGSRRLVPG